MKFVIIACLVGAAVARPGITYEGKYGVCPSDFSAAPLICDGQETCYSDLDCSGPKKCCKSPCGKICYNPEVPVDTVKPGQCPVSAEQPEDVCSQENTVCQEDIECGSIKKCCNTECGEKRCLIPTDADEIIRDKWTSFFARKVEYADKWQKYPPPADFIKELFNKTDVIKMCTTTPWELKKCHRMAIEFTYTLQPKKEWRCALAKSPEHCMFWLEQGYVDVMVTREEDIFKAKTKYNLIPVAYEVPFMVDTTPVLKGKQNITVVLAHAATDVDTWSEMEGSTSCHVNANSTASFKSPICSLIQKNIIPKKGDFIESASEFFDEMCVPDILDDVRYNKNQTFPDNLSARCVEKKFQKKYETIEGTLKCIDETKGQVTFVDHKVIQNMIATQDKLIAEGVSVPRPVDNYKLVCQDRSYPLSDWAEKSCHVSTTPYPTIFMSSKKDMSWKRMLQDLLKEAVKSFTSKSKTESFRIFESTPYTCPMNGKPGTNLIFSDESKNFTMLEDDYSYTDDFFSTMETCNQLQSKPRAIFCVTQPEQYLKCLEMKKYFDKTDQVKDVAWGCVKALNDLECMKTVLNGTADLTSADMKATFIAGHDFKLQPIISQYLHKESDEQVYDWKTYTHTVGVMKKSLVTLRFGENAKYVNLAELRTCHAGVNKVSSFHHPIGWLLANGTIPRIGSVFESVSRFFKSSCLPGVHPDSFRYEDDLVLGHELNWGVPGVHLFNFSQPEFFIWNSPHTWTYMNWNGMTPRFYPKFLRKNSLLGLKYLDLKYLEQDSSTKTEEGIDMEIVADLLDQLPTILRAQLQTTPRFDPVTGYTTDNMKQERTMTKGRTILDKIKKSLIESDVSKKGSAIIKMRFDAMEQVEDMLAYYLDIPSMPTIQGEEHTWLTHPAIQRYLQVYTPQVLDYFSELFDNNELRQHEFSRYTNPLWLSPSFREFLETTKSHQNKLCETCTGYGSAKCSATTTEPYYDYAGSLKCLRDDSGDIVFVESHRLDKLVGQTADLSISNLVLVCPTGEVVNYVEGDIELVKRCSFGRVPQPTIVTAYNKTGSYRWNVTKALLKAQQIFSHHSENVFHFRMFGLNSVFDPLTVRLHPINPVNQTYQTWMGPMFLRSMEALVKPSSFDWWKQMNHTCWGETYTNILSQRNYTCNAIVKDVTCVGTPQNKLVYLGRIGEKQPKMVKMCSRPTRFERKMGEFSCDNGDSYLKLVTLPTACECVPCEETTISATWNKDYFWTKEERKFDPMSATTEDHWGNEDFWSDNTLNQNFNLQEELEHNGVVSKMADDANTTPKTMTTCESSWKGKTWQSEWFPEDRNRQVCQVPGLSKDKLIKKMIELWN